MIKKFIIGIALNGLGLYVTTLILSEIQYTGGPLFFVVAGTYMGIINGLIKPFLKILALPIIFLSAGLFIIVINAILLWSLTYFLEVIAFQDLSLVIPNKGSYLLAALIFGFINWIEHQFIKNR